MNVYSAMVGNNAGLIELVCELYVSEGDTIADVTYGKGAFWRKVEVDVTASDIIHTVRPYDFNRLPYDDCSFDHVVFDPPYVHTPGKKFQKDANYRNSDTHIREKGGEKYHKAVVQRYRTGMCEACRVARKFVWVKCQDEVCSGLQWWTHIEVLDIGRRLGLYARDLFVLQQSRKPTIQHKRQLHARKNHSYLWIFEKPDSAKRRLIFRNGA